MKTIVMILLCFLSTMGFSQSSEPAEFYVAPELNEALQSINERGEVFGKDFISTLHPPAG